MELPRVTKVKLIKNSSFCTFERLKHLTLFTKWKKLEMKSFLSHFREGKHFDSFEPLSDESNFLLLMIESKMNEEIFKLYHHHHIKVGEKETFWRKLKSSSFVDSIYTFFEILKKFS